MLSFLAPTTSKSENIDMKCRPSPCAGSNKAYAAFDRDRVLATLRATASACENRKKRFMFKNPFLLSPASRGRGILVTPGFCPASNVRRPASRFLVGAKTQKLLVNFF